VNIAYIGGNRQAKQTFVGSDRFLGIGADPQLTNVLSRNFGSFWRRLPKSRLEQPMPALSSCSGWQPSVWRSPLWVLFILCVMATASMAAGAGLRLLGPAIADATPLASPICSYAGPRTISPACSAADTSISLKAQQYEAAMQCAGNTDQRICADLVTRSAQKGTLVVPPPRCDPASPDLRCTNN
jgi:hypothetical protein